MPVVVDSVAGTLTASSGVIDLRGFVAQLFIQPADDAVFVPFPGDVLRLNLPGFDVRGGSPPNGLSGGDQLFMEPVARRDFTAPGEPLRWLWYWDPATQEVATVPNNLRLELAAEDGTSSTSFRQSTAPTSAAVRLALLDADNDLDQHRHFLEYFLDNPPQTPAAIGAYGFFARLTAPGYSPSTPFFIGLNNLVDPETLELAAREINAAARLPGDFDKDDDADGADFLGWQRTFGSTTTLAADWELDDVVDWADLARWRTNFGRVVGSAVAAAAGGVPEPGTAWGLSAGIAALAAAAPATLHLERALMNGRVDLALSGHGVAGGQGVHHAGVDRVVDEPHAAVAEDEVAPARVDAAKRFGVGVQQVGVVHIHFFDIKPLFERRAQDVSWTSGVFAGLLVIEDF